MPQEVKRKLRISHLGKRLSPATEFKLGLVPWNKGLKGLNFSPQTQFKKGQAPWNKGKTDIYSQETIQKMREAKLGVFVGEKSPTWRGGKSLEPYGAGWTETLKRAIRERDGWKCQSCGCPQIECKQALCVHHINGDKHNFDPCNLIALCKSCHMTLHHREYRGDLK